MAEGTEIGVVLLQLGTPAAPTTQALRRYLAEFLSDRRVIDLPRALWWPILHLVVLRTRPRRSAHLYQKIWTAGGSPLALISAAQAAGLEAGLSRAWGTRVPVAVGMRYGEPSIASALARLTAEGGGRVGRILAFPMFPQYSSATTGSSLECLFDEVGRMRVMPAIRVVPPYYVDPLYINALASVARRALASLSEQPDRLLLSFHGLPKRYAEAGDPYFQHCQASAAELESPLQSAARPVSVAFQSRFGREEWLQPYLEDTLRHLGHEGARVAVMCPGFTADCLETLEEIGLRGAEAFREAGGRAFHLIPCLNDDPAWIDAMTAIALRELSGWRA